MHIVVIPHHLFPTSSLNPLQAGLNAYLMLTTTLKEVYNLGHNNLGTGESFSYEILSPKSLSEGSLFFITSATTEST